MRMINFNIPELHHMFCCEEHWCKIENENSKAKVTNKGRQYYNEKCQYCGKMPTIKITYVVEK